MRAMALTRPGAGKLEAIDVDLQDQVLATSWSACSRAVSAEPIFTSSMANYQDRRSRLFPATRSSVA